MDRVPQLRRREPDGGGQETEWPQRTLARYVLGGGQRELGLRGQHDRGVLCRPIQTLCFLCKKLSECTRTQNCRRSQRWRLSLDGNADEKCAGAYDVGTVLTFLYHS